MKKSFVLAMVICLTISVLGISMDIMPQPKKKPQMAGRVTEGFQVSAIAAKELTASGMPIRLRVKIRNTTKKPLYLAEAGVEKDYKVQISSDTGKTILLTQHGKAVLNDGVYMNLSLIIQPGQEREDLLEISNIYDMKIPGNYWIVVSRKVGRLAGKGVTQAESNTVHIQVVKK